MSFFEPMLAEGHEQVVVCADRGAGLTAIIGIHDTTLGPALGGIRMRSYAGEDEALTDALRLSQAMTYKASLAGLSYGGGKAVVAVLGEPPANREALFRALGRAIQSLGGRYIPTEDMGTTTADLEHILAESRFGAGRGEVFGGGGDPSPMTAWGILCGLRACLEETDGRADFRGLKVALPGLGKVGFALAGYLHEAGAELIVADLDEGRMQKAESELGARIVDVDTILEQDCDILAPCAAGGIFNADTIPRLRCRIIGGGANNQLLTEDDGDAIHARGILYAPDFAINAGGLINVADELTPGGYRRERAKAETNSIFDTLKTIFAQAKQRDVPPHRLAVTLAQERIQAVRELRRLNAAV